MSEKLYHFCNDDAISNSQKKVHLDFVDNSGVEQTSLCLSEEAVNRAIYEHGIEAVIIGSDAVLQHHTWMERIKKGNRKLFYIQSVDPDRMFPNMFWGVGFNHNIKLALMSVSSQNSRYKLFPFFLRRKMRKSLNIFSYISARDSWTAEMIHHLLGKHVDVTPDPVFAFNYNCNQFFVDKDIILSKHGLPDNYVLVCLRNQLYNEGELFLLKSEFKRRGYECVAFPISTGVMFKHPFDYEIKCPLSPDEWYLLIKYSQAYVGCNMHPIIVSLHNSVPCYSLDDYVNYDFFKHPILDNSSKIEHIMGVFELSKSNRSTIADGLSKPSVIHIVDAIIAFPSEKVKRCSNDMYVQYKLMMNNILKSLKDETSF